MHEPSFFPSWVVPTLQVIVAFLFIIALIRMFGGWKPSIVYGHWDLLIPSFDYSVGDFYFKVHEALKSHDLQDVDFEEIYLYESTRFFSPQRNYYRVMWREKVFDICAAPYADGFFVSWWLFEKEPFWLRLLSKIPGIGPWLVSLIKPVTYYKIDTARMFQAYLQHSVVAAIEEITATKGVRLTEAQKTPTSYDILKRK
ncbi:MAG: hypothetical protein M0D57_04715 [Sphingobacteriales bacterium JAD_PAG50586_3]|nr:MAG: hypothetical protein M0D57_04715 [Sphingobacteriales bacterium JAD_PAG50586_3]